MQYPVFLEKCKDGYSAAAPDIPGCASGGRTLEQALANLKEAILFHLEGLAKDGMDAPRPTSLEEHRHNPDYATAQVWALLEVPAVNPQGKAVRLSITMNEHVLRRVDQAAQHLGETRSGLLQQAVTALLDRQSQPRHARPSRSGVSRKSSRRPARSSR